MTRRAELRPEGATREARRARRGGRAAVRVRVRPDARNRGGGRRRCAEGAESGDSVRVAGRLVAWRGHGKTAFAHLADGAGRIQLYFRKDELGDERWAQLDLYDIGDVVGVAGPLMRTRTGEVTVRVASRRDAREVAASASVRQGRDRGRRRRCGIRGSPIPSSAIASATRTSPCTPRCARCSSRAVAAHFGDPQLPRRTRLPRSRDARAAAAVRRRGGATVHDASQCARHAAVPAHRGRAVSQAARRRRVRSRVRDRPRLPERGDRPHAQSRVHDARVLPGLRGLSGDDDRRGGASWRTPPRRCDAIPGVGEKVPVLDAALSAHRLGGVAERGTGSRRHELHGRGAPARGACAQCAERRRAQPAEAARRAVSGARRERRSRRRRSWSTTRWSCRRWPSRSAAIPA